MNTIALADTLDAIATLIERGDFKGAEQRAQAALQFFPLEAEPWRLLAIAQLKAGKFDAALKALQRARTLAPRSVDVLCNLASLEIQSGKVDEARLTLEQALALAPDHIGALINLGRVRHHLGDYAGAVQCFEHRARLQPGQAEAWLDLANCRIAQFQWSSAEAHLQHALKLNPRSADAWYLIGYLHERSGRLAEAVAPYRTALDLRPNARTAHNLGLVLDQLGDWQGAARALEFSLQLDPNLAESLGQLTFAKRRLCDWNGLSALSARLTAAVAARTRGVAPFSFLIEDTTPALQLECARTFARQFHTASALSPGAVAIKADGAGDTPIRVGFVSSGFNQHATGLLVVEMIERLRDSPLHTLAFATTADDGTVMRRRLLAAFDEFHDIAQQPPGDIAMRIRAAQVDVLIDLDGYCMGSLPQLFALRPAPIQINWLAYPGSLGALWYDYLIADRFLIPEAQRAHYAEKIAWLPRCYQPTDTTRIIVEPPVREACGLPPRSSSAQAFVYCCFNNTWKFTPRSFALWMRILHAVPDSVLWLLEGPSGNGIGERLREAARQAGIDAQRIVFSPKLNHADYLARFRHADLFLDTNPYNAHTTASDAIYAGCPVLTRPGDTFASRVAGSLNYQLGIDELNAGSDDDYLRLAVELAQQPDRLAALRDKLADPVRRARLFDMRAYTRDFAQLLTQIVERARRGETATDISL